MSTLEPLLGTLLGSPWCLPNHISLSFPFGVHMLGPWTREYMFLVWKWSDFKLFQELWELGYGYHWFLTEWVGEERSDSWLKLPSFLSHQLQLHVTWEMMKFQLVEEGFNPWWTHVLFWYDLDKLGLNRKGLQLFNCAGFWLVSSCDLLLLAFVCELGWSSWAL